MSHCNPLPPGAFPEKAWGRVEDRAVELLRQNGIFTDAQIAFVEMVPSSKTKVVGAAAISQKYDKAKETVQIGFDVAVDEKHRGCGLGRLLVEAVLAEIEVRAKFTTSPHVVVDVLVVNDKVMEMLRRRGFDIRYHGGTQEWHATRIIR